jgi:ribose-phosphate pyrophosphokinase
MVDDMVSTGHTLARAAQLLREAGAARVDAAVTHALFVGEALQAMRAAGVAEIWSTDSIAHPTNRIALAPLLAESLRDEGAEHAGTPGRALR